ncbi:hypothetical protein FB385_2386 [Paramicrobacterium agarici]|nr:hypothetical protein FB385_2386 [Microbacterium agarici]
MPVPLSWAPNFNTQLRNLMDDPSPTTVSPVALPDFRHFGSANSQALQFLDRRLADSNGMLPLHVCAAAHGTWEHLEGLCCKNREA